MSSRLSASGCPRTLSAVRPQYTPFRRKCAVRWYARSLFWKLFSKRQGKRQGPDRGAAGAHLIQLLHVLDVQRNVERGHRRVVLCRRHCASRGHVGAVKVGAEISVGSSSVLEQPRDVRSGRFHVSQVEVVESGGRSPPEVTCCPSRTDHQQTAWPPHHTHRALDSMSRRSTRRSDAAPATAAAINRLSAQTSTTLRSSLVIPTLAQILSELAQNSLDAGAKRIDVWVNVAPGDESLRVQDDGSGMSREQLGSIGERYGKSSCAAPLTHSDQQGKRRLCPWRHLWLSRRGSRFHRRALLARGYEPRRQVRHLCASHQGEVGHWHKLTAEWQYYLHWQGSGHGHLTARYKCERTRRVRSGASSSSSARQWRVDSVSQGA